MSNAGGVGGSSRSSSFKGLDSVAPKIDKIGVGQAGAAGAAAEVAAPGLDVAKKAFDVAQKFTADADKFVKLAAQANPFSSQQVGLMKDALVKGADDIKKALDDWGKFIREQAEKDKTADLQAQLLKKPIEQAQVKAEDIAKRGL
jgi:hypothetical protein